MKKLYLVAVFALGFVQESLAQQDPHYTQYMYNMNVINPAYAGSKENLTIGLLYRQQWVGLDGAPTTGTLSASSPIGKNAGLGLSFISDQIGPVQENNIYADYAYTLRLGGEHRLAFGLKAGVTMHQVGLFSDVDPSLPQPNDPAFHENTSRSYLNIGSGVFYYTNKYYLGLSVPNMMKSTHLQYKDPDDANAMEQEFGTDVSHYFLTGGYVFDVNDKVKFKPFFMLKSAFNVKPSIDLSTNFLFNDKFEVGATYRMEDSFGAMLGYRVTPNIRLGYAYDHVISDLRTTSPSSHEFIALFDLNFPKKVSRSPRYF